MILCKNNRSKRSTSRNKTTEEFIEDSVFIHSNKYDYSVVDYVNDSTLIRIICLLHGEFIQKPSNHLRGQGCPYCGGTKRKTTSQFIEESNNIHNNLYDYSLTSYHNNKTKVKVICSIHGMFEVAPKLHLRGIGCPGCKRSKGENAIASFLTSNNIKFTVQETLIPTNRKLRFDFWLPDFNCVIEYDGIQHFEPVERFGGIEAFNKTTNCDSIKNQFCIDNEIDIIRISYKQYKDVSNILTMHLIRL